MPNIPGYTTAKSVSIPGYTEAKSTNIPGYTTSKSNDVNIDKKKFIPGLQPLSDAELLERFAGIVNKKENMYQPASQRKLVGEINTVIPTPIEGLAEAMFAAGLDSPLKTDEVNVDAEPRNTREIQPDSSAAGKVLHTLNLPLQGAWFNLISNSAREAGGKLAYEKDVAESGRVAKAWKDLDEKEREYYREQNIRPEIIRSTEQRNKEAQDKTTKRFAEIYKETRKWVESMDAKGYKPSPDEIKTYQENLVNESVAREGFNAMPNVVDEETGRLRDTSQGKLVSLGKGQTSAHDILTDFAALDKYEKLPLTEKWKAKAARVITDNPILDRSLSFLGDVLLSVDNLITGGASGVAKAGKIAAKAGKSTGLKAVQNVGETVGKIDLATAGNEAIEKVSKAVGDKIKQGVRDGDPIMTALYSAKRIDPTQADTAIEKLVYSLPMPDDWSPLRRNRVQEVLLGAMKKQRYAEIDDASKLINDFKELAKETGNKGYINLPAQSKKDMIFAFENYYDPVKRMGEIKEALKAGKEATIDLFGESSISKARNPLIDDLMSYIPIENRNMVYELINRKNQTLVDGIKSGIITEANLQDILPNYMKQISVDDTKQKLVSREIAGSIDEKEAFRALQQTINSPEAVEKLRALNYTEDQIDAMRRVVQGGDRAGDVGINDPRILGLATDPALREISASYPIETKLNQIFDVEKGMTKYVPEVKTSIDATENLPKFTKERLKELYDDSFEFGGGQATLKQGSFVDAASKLDMSFSELGEVLQEATAYGKTAKGEQLYKYDLPLGMLQSEAMERKLISRKRFFDNMAKYEGNGVVEKVRKKNIVQSELAEAERLAKETGDSTAANNLRGELKRIESMEKQGLKPYKKTQGFQKETWLVKEKGLEVPRELDKAFDYYVLPEYIDALDNYTRNYKGIVGALSGMMSAWKSTTLGANISSLGMIANNAATGVIMTSAVSKNPAIFTSAYVDAMKGATSAQQGKDVFLNLGGKMIPYSQLEESALRAGMGGDIMSDVLQKNAATEFALHGKHEKILGKVARESALDFAKNAPAENPMTQAVFNANGKTELLNRMATLIAYMKSNPKASLKDAVAKVRSLHADYIVQSTGAKAIKSLPVPFLTYTGMATKALLTDYNNLAALQRGAIATDRGIRGQDQTKASYGGQKTEAFHQQRYKPMTLQTKSGTVDLGRMQPSDPLLYILHAASGDPADFSLGMLGFFAPYIQEPIKLVANKDPYRATVSEPYSMGLAHYEGRPFEIGGGRLYGDRAKTSFLESVKNTVPFGLGVSGAARMISDTANMDIPTTVQGLASGVKNFRSPSKSDYREPVSAFTPIKMATPRSKKNSDMDLRTARGMRIVDEEQVTSATKEWGQQLQKMERLDGGKTIKEWIENNPDWANRPEIDMPSDQDARNTYGGIIKKAPELLKHAETTYKVIQDAMTTKEAEIEQWTKVSENAKMGSSYLARLEAQYKELFENKKDIVSKIENLALYENFAKQRMRMYQEERERREEMKLRAIEQARVEQSRTNSRLR